MRKRKSCVGIDLHRNQFTYCVRYEDGEEKIGKEKIENLKWFAGLSWQSCFRSLGSDGKHLDVLSNAEGSSWPTGGCEPESVQSHQPVGEKDRQK